MLDSASSCSGLSWSRLVLDRWTQISMSNTYLPSSSRWILSTKKMQSRSALRGSLWREPQDSAKAGNLCWIHSDYAEPVRHLCNAGNFRVSCGIHPPVWQHFRYLSFTSLQTMKCLNFCYSLKNMQKPQYWLCMPRNKNLHAVTQSHSNNLKFTSSKNQGKKSHSMSGKPSSQQKCMHWLAKIRPNGKIQFLRRYKEKLTYCDSHSEAQNLTNIWRLAVLRCESCWPRICSHIKTLLVAEFRKGLLCHGLNGNFSRQTIKQYFNRILGGLYIYTHTCTGKRSKYQITYNLVWLFTRRICHLL